MKKIVAVAALASVLAGATFAADISFSYKGSNYFSSNGAAGVKYDNAARKDCMSFGLKNDYAGAVVDFDLDTSKATDLTLDEYYGWMNFAAISTQFTAGVWNSRYLDRVKTDAGDLDDEDFEAFKPGVVKLDLTKTTLSEMVVKSVASDSDNLTEGSVAMAAAYTNTDALPGKLMAKLVFVNSSWDSFEKSDSDGTYKRDNKYGFAGEVAYRQEGAFDVNLAVKTLKAHNYSFGLFFSPLMIEKLQATVGVSLGLDGNTTYKIEGDTGTEFAFDLRARYALTEKLSFTTMHNISSALTTTGKDGDAKKWNDNTTAMWNMINVSYVLADNLKFGMTLSHLIGDFKKSYPEANSLVVSPALAIQATEKAKVTVAARATFNKIGLPGQPYSNFDFKVPVIFSFNY